MSPPVVGDEEKNVLERFVITDINSVRLDMFAANSSHMMQYTQLAWLWRTTQSVLLTKHVASGVMHLPAKWKY